MSTHPLDLTPFFQAFHNFSTRFIWERWFDTTAFAIPVLSFEVDGDAGFSVFDISHELRARGFQVPAYTMPADAEDVAVLRIVLREGFSRDMAYKLVLAIREGQFIRYSLNTTVFQEVVQQLMELGQQSNGRARKKEAKDA